MTLSDARLTAFWSKVNKTDGCWLWTAGTLKTGYGRFSVRGHNQRAHRVSWQIANGPIPEGLWVLHKCDVRNCVRPDHLFLGDVAANAICGERQGSAKLTVAQAKEIKERYAEGGTTMRKLACQYDVGGTTIYRVVNEVLWTRALSEAGAGV